MIRNPGNSIFIILLCITVVFVGCSSRKSVSTHHAVDRVSVDIVSSSPSARIERKCLSGNVRLSADIDGKSLSARGTIRIKGNEGVQIGVMALGLMEIACLEFLPSNLRVINKIEKEYSEISYSDVYFLQRTGIDYDLLESVLLNRFFSPDGKPAAEALKDGVVEAGADTITVTFPEYKGLVYKFFFDRATSNLVQSEGIYRSGAKVVCSYQDFEDLDGTPFPSVISLSLGGVGKVAKLRLELRNVNSGMFDFSPRKVSSSYEKLDASSFMKSLGNI